MALWCCWMKFVSLCVIRMGSESLGLISEMKIVFVLENFLRKTNLILDFC